MYAATQRNRAVINPGAVWTPPHVFEKNRLSSLWCPSHFLIRLLKNVGEDSCFASNRSWLQSDFWSGHKWLAPAAQNKCMMVIRIQKLILWQYVPFNKQGAVSQLTRESSPRNFHWLSWPPQHNLPPVALFFNVNELDWFHYSTTVPWEKSQIH